MRASCTRSSLLSSFQGTETLNVTSFQTRVPFVFIFFIALLCSPLSFQTRFFLTIAVHFCKVELRAACVCVCVLRFIARFVLYQLIVFCATGILIEITTSFFFFSLTQLVCWLLHRRSRQNIAARLGCSKRIAFRGVKHLSLTIVCLACRHRRRCLL